MKVISLETLEEIIRHRIEDYQSQEWAHFPREVISHKVHALETIKNLLKLNAIELSESTQETA